MPFSKLGLSEPLLKAIKEHIPLCSKDYRRVLYITMYWPREDNRADFSEICPVIFQWPFLDLAGGGIYTVCLRRIRFCRREALKTIKHM